MFTCYCNLRSTVTVVERLRYGNITLYNNIYHHIDRYLQLTVGLIAVGTFNNSAWIPCSTTRPPCRTAIASAFWTVLMRCAKIMMVFRIICRILSSASWTMRSDSFSTAEVASSGSRRWGSILQHRSGNFFVFAVFDAAWTFSLHCYIRWPAQFSAVATLSDPRWPGEIPTRVLARVSPKSGCETHPCTPLTQNRFFSPRNEMFPFPRHITGLSVAAVAILLCEWPRSQYTLNRQMDYTLSLIKEESRARKLLPELRSAFAFAPPVWRGWTFVLLGCILLRGLFHCRPQIHESGVRRPSFGRIGSTHIHLQYGWLRRTT